MENDGGPAFPKPCDPCSCNGVRGASCTVAYDGTSFRDVAAIAAMQGILASNAKTVKPKDAAVASLNFAQALTDERKRRIDDEQAS